MRYRPLSSDLYIKNRKKFMDAMKPNSIAIFFSNEVLPKSADGTMMFKQNTDIQYLTGIDQEETILILFPNCPDEKSREILFVVETNEVISLWEGEKFSKTQATELSGVSRVEWASNYYKLINPLINLAENIYLNLNEHDRFVSELEYTDLRKAKEIVSHFPLHKFERSAPIMHHLRAVKEKEEIEILQKCCDITHSAFERVLKFVKPGVMEYEIEAEITHEFIRNAAEGHAYTPIIGSGFSSCVLHYITNDKACKDGDVLLMDFGCAYGNYNADLTRVIPVNGKFSQRQKDVYNAVLRSHRFAAEKLVPGALRLEIQEEVGLFLQEELVQLGLLSAEQIKNAPAGNPAYKKYFAHGFSHYLGLDVHDLGSKYRPMEAGMVFTVEPGLYINSESIGIRLENNYVVQSTGSPFDLMRNIPIEADEVESLMK